MFNWEYQLILGKIMHKYINMFENIIFSPLNIVSGDLSEEVHLKNMLKEAWIPICRLQEKDELNEKIKKENPDVNIISMIFGIGFIKPYYG